ncbi:uncharacterized protein SRS1_15149 [Sporisorium reilianum f. sp. reilianum]|uniref:Mig1 protein n=1 Tax=Sporisorium reilianum f. sp. reilianum TaxID=72559 RepID=A0A2N8UIC5_9BASI|nr:uncharacterized protein SRS1_15149 [Sporisorium reilianum f. sp. reilianum]
MRSLNFILIATAFALMICSSEARAVHNYATYCQRRRGSPALPANLKFACFKTRGPLPLFGSNALQGAAFYAKPSNGREFAIVFTAGDGFAKFAAGASTVQLDARGTGRGCFIVAITQDASGVPSPDVANPHCSGQSAIWI